MVASFDVLMQNFYKVTHGNQEKVPSFTTRLEGTSQLNLAKVPWEDSRPQGGMPPQRPTIPWGVQAYKRLNKVSTWQPQDHVLPANGCSQRS